MKCPNAEPHDPHWYVIRAGSITVAQGECLGVPAPAADGRVPPLDPHAPAEEGPA